MQCGVTEDDVKFTEVEQSLEWVDRRRWYWKLMKM